MAPHKEPSIGTMTSLVGGGSAPRAPSPCLVDSKTKDEHDQNLKSFHAALRSVSNRKKENTIVEEVREQEFIPLMILVV